LYIIVNFEFQVMCRKKVRGLLFLYRPNNSFQDLRKTTRSLSQYKEFRLDSNPVRFKCESSPSSL